MANGDQTVTYRWIAGGVMSLIVLGISAWMNTIHTDVANMSDTMTRVRMEIVGLRADVKVNSIHGSKRHEKQLTDHEKRIDDLEKR